MSPDPLETMPQDPSAPPPLVCVHGTSTEGATAVALEMADLIESRPATVLGLATGGTMISVYAALAAEVARRSLDVSQLKTFNLDEYLGLAPGDQHSFRAFMETHFVGPMGLGAEQVHFPDEQLAKSDGPAAARSYEEAILAAGGLDFQLLGIGRNGHIAFNEPGSSADSRTRVVELHGVTRSDAAPSFGGLDATPTHAITMGIATVLEARALRVLAFGEPKAEVVCEMLRSGEDASSPCTYLRFRHRDLAVHLDQAAAQLLA